MSSSKVDKKCENCQYRNACNHMRMVAMAEAKPKNSITVSSNTASRGKRSECIVIDEAISNDAIDFDFMQKSLSIIEKRLLHGRKS